MSTQVVGCYHCKRLLAEWVVTSKLTMNHQGKNYCRFCYSELRLSGELDAVKDDSEFLATVVREAMQKDAIQGVSKYKANAIFSSSENEVKLQHIDIPNNYKIAELVCPECQSPFKVRLVPGKSVFGKCSNCQTYLSISANKVKTLSVREHMVMSISHRSGQSTELVELMFSYLMDELSAQLAERSMVDLPNLGMFRVYCSSISENIQPNNLEVTFRAGKKLFERIARRRSIQNIKKKIDVMNLFDVSFRFMDIFTFV